MDKNELLKYLICEIDLVMHDKDYRFENEDGTWYSRESCKNLTNEEVFEELKSELRQLAKIEDDFADLEAKLAEMQNEKDELISKYRYWKGECAELKQQLAEKDQAIEGLQEINQSLGQTCNNDAKEIDRLREQLAEKEKEIEELKKGVYKVTLGTTPSNQIDFTENFYVIQNQTAIAELEKVKEYIRRVISNTFLIEKFIDQQIKELKGE